MIYFLFVSVLFSFTLVFIIKAKKHRKKLHIILSVVFSATFFLSAYYYVSEAALLRPSIGKQKLESMDISTPKVYRDSFNSAEQQEFDGKSYKKLSASFWLKSSSNDDYKSHIYYKTVCYQFDNAEDAEYTTKFIVTNRVDFPLYSLKTINNAVKYRKEPEQTMFLTSVPDYLLTEKKNDNYCLYYSPTIVEQYNNRSFFLLGSFPGGEYITVYAFRQNEFVFVIYETTYCNNKESQIDALLKYLNSDNTEINFNDGYYAEIMT